MNAGPSTRDPIRRQEGPLSTTRDTGASQGFLSSRGSAESGESSNSTLWQPELQALPEGHAPVNKARTSFIAASKVVKDKSAIQEVVSAVHNTAGGDNELAPEVWPALDHWLRWVMPTVYLSAKQITHLLKIIVALGGLSDADDPSAIDKDKAGVVITLTQTMWTRLVDEENLHRITEYLGSDLLKVLRHRLGILSVFSPLEPDARYTLDLKCRDNQIVANCLLQLANKEPGENIVGESFNGKKFQTPPTWLQLLPSEGVWECTYTTGPFSKRPGFRKAMALRLLGWEFDDDEEVVADEEEDYVDPIINETREQRQQRKDNKERRRGQQLWDIVRNWFLNKMERQELLSTYLVNAKSIKEAGVAAFNDDDMDDVDISFGNLEENNRPDDKTKPIIIRKGAL